MKEETIEIKKSNVLNSYEKARKAGAKAYMMFLEELFGKEMFGKEMFKPKDVRERIKTFEDACEELGAEHPYVKAYERAQNYMTDSDDDMNAYLKLRIITAALNEGWKPQFTENEYRYLPWFYFCSKDEFDEMKEDELRHALRRASSNAYVHGGLVYAYTGYVSSTSSTQAGCYLV